jgi:alpha-L-rhamnosidase
MNRYFIILLIPLLLFQSCIEKSEEKIIDILFSKLLCDYVEDPLGIDNIHPHFTWKVKSDVSGNYQTAYQILVASTPFLLDKNEGDIWDSGRINSSQSKHIKYEGPLLKSRKRYYWKVRIWDKTKNPSIYSPTAKWEMGLLDPEDWDAQWISAPKLFDWSRRDQQRKQLTKDAPPEREEPSPIFRKEFVLDGKAKSARAYVSGLGYYELYINGKKVGDNVLDPAFTAYDKKVLYTTYDITEYLDDSLNAVGVMLGNGWYNMFSRGVWSFDKSPWRDDPALKLQIRVASSQGTIHQIISDTSWTCSPGPVIFNSIRQGEEYDAALEQAGWSNPGFYGKHWFAVRKVRGPEGKMVAQTMPPMKILKKLDPVKIYKTTKNTLVCDFGQNMSGFIEFSANTVAGRRIQFKYGERLLDDGSVDQRNIDGLVASSPFQTDVYITKGGGLETWHPRFTYHGFQYVEIEGFPEMAINNIKACLVSTSMLKKGAFSCSNELLTKIQTNAEWSFRSNYHGYPTDCPHREKNGWTGDGQLASDMALYNYHVEPSYKKWIEDIIDSQLPTGMVSAIVPTGGWGYYWGNGPAWDYALIILPWNVYKYSGDKQMLEKYYPAMEKYLDFLSGTAEDYTVRWGLGDWVPVRTVTPPELITTAYYYHDAIIMAKIAGVLGLDIDVNKYNSLASNIKNAFKDHFFDESEVLIGNGSQTSLSCPLYFKMLDSDISEKVLDKLVENILSDDINLDFGVLGSKFVPNALAEMGKIEVAYNMINTTDFPGWGHWISQGANTLWEDWNGENSRNHIFFGDVSAWFYKYLGGIRPDENQPGFKHFIIQPYFADDLSWVKCNMESMYGTISSNWEKNDEQVTMEVQIPFNTTATIRFPGEIAVTIRDGDQNFITPEAMQKKNDFTEFKLSSGAYFIQIE